MITALALLTSAHALTVDASRPNGPVDIVNGPDAFGDVNDAEAYRHRARLVRFRASGIANTAQLTASFQIVDRTGNVGDSFHTPENFVPCGDWHDGNPSAGSRDLCWRAPVEGTYRATVTDGTSTVVLDVPVRDVWVASVGDSYSSGEGNPDTPSVRSSFLGVSSHTEPRWREGNCHRSAHGWPFQIAESIQADDPEAQVLFTYLACSGAKVSRGLIEPYGGVANEVEYPPQLDVIEEIMATTGVSPHHANNDLAHQFGYTEPHGPDVLLMTAGGNDGGFADIVKDCIKTQCYDTIDAEGHRQDFQEAAHMLAARLDDMGIPFHQRLQLEYPDFTTSNDLYWRLGGSYIDFFDDTCFSGNANHFTDDIKDSSEELKHDYIGPTGSIDEPGTRDFAFIYHELIAQAPSMIQSANTGRYVSGSIDAFLGHGVCETTDPWIHTLETSTATLNYMDEDADVWDFVFHEGEADFERSIKGAYHPNVRGHAELTNLMYGPALTTARDRDVLAPHRPDLETRMLIAGAEFTPNTIYWHDDVVSLSHDPRIEHTFMLNGHPVPFTGRLDIPGGGVHSVRIERAFTTPGLPDLPLSPIEFLARGAEQGLDLHIVDDQDERFGVPHREGHTTYFDAYTWVGDISLQPTSPEGPVEVSLTHEATGNTVDYISTGATHPPASQYTNSAGEYNFEMCVQGTSRCAYGSFTIRDQHEDLRLDNWVEFRGRLNYLRRFTAYNGLDNGAMQAWAHNAGVLNNDVTAQVGLARDMAWAEVTENWSGDYIGRFTGSEKLDLGQDAGSRSFMVTACYNPLRGCTEGTGFGRGETMLVADRFDITGAHSSDFWGWYFGPTFTTTGWSLSL